MHATGILRAPRCGPMGLQPLAARRVNAGRGVGCRTGGRTGLPACVMASSATNMALRPTAAEIARTMADIAAEGTLSVQGTDGWPLGMSARYVLDDAGQPILLVPAKAAYAASLASNGNCSLHVQARRCDVCQVARCALFFRRRGLRQPFVPAAFCWGARIVTSDIAGHSEAG